MQCWLDMTRKASWANYRFEHSCNEFSWSADLEQLQILTTRSTNRDNLKLFRFLSSCYHFVSPSDRGKHSKTFYTRSIERRIKARTDRQEGTLAGSIVVYRLTNYVIIVRSSSYKIGVKFSMLTKEKTFTRKPSCDTVTVTETEVICSA